MEKKETKIEVVEELKNPKFKPSDYKPTKHDVGALKENIDENRNINP